LIHSSVNNDRPGSKQDIESLGHHSFVNNLAREARKNTKHNDWNVLHQVFVEHVADHVSISSVSLSTMGEHENLQVFELAESIV
jgi:hypothetical protein